MLDKEICWKCKGHRKYLSNNVRSVWQAVKETHSIEPTVPHEELMKYEHESNWENGWVVCPLENIKIRHPITGDPPETCLLKLEHIMATQKC